MNDLSSLNTDVVKNVAKKLYLSNGKIRTTSKGRFNTRTKLAAITEKKKKIKFQEVSLEVLIKMIMKIMKLKGLYILIIAKQI